ncbi:MAG: iron-containing alcohol dehydrogenase [Promethearchaeota archaeon]
MKQIKLLNFNFAKIPFVRFGVGMINELGEISKKIGNNAILITGKYSLEKSGHLNFILQDLQSNNIKIFHERVSGEPSPELIDEIVNKYREKNIEFIIGIGGGSVLDVGKAVSAMLLENESVINFLEGVGTKKPSGKKIPYIAVPTTAGTGSEATKNAVLSRIGKDGFKKSLRHDNYVPDYAIIDPELISSCPPNIAASCGMDAFSQLVESYVSTKASPPTDSLAIFGIKLMIENLPLIVSINNGNYQNDQLQNKDFIDFWAKIAYATFISGITLANAGLGVVHGFASSIGGLYNIPHGVICGTLMATSNKVTIELLKKRIDSNDTWIYLRKFAYIGLLFENINAEFSNKAEIAIANNNQSEKNNKRLIIPEIAGISICPLNRQEILNYCDLFINNLNKLTESLRIKKLGEFGVRVDDLSLITSKTSNKNNPIMLNSDQIIEILKERI